MLPPSNIPVAASHFILVHYPPFGTTVVGMTYMSTYFFLSLHASLLSWCIVMSVRHFIYRDWNRFAGTLAGVFIVAWSIITMHYGFQMWHVIGSE